ncbi:MAG: flagellar biosynthesis protein FlgA [Massilia sp.]|nr:flagellar biosynthesis protein FlgA [Massilia sp.]
MRMERLAACVATLLIAMPAAAQVTAEVQKAAREELARKADSAALTLPLFDVEVVRSSRPVAACARPVTIEAIDTRQPARMRFAAVCPAPEGWRHEFVVRAGVTAMVLVSASELPAARPLEAGDVKLERRDVSAVADSIGSPQAAIGLVPKRQLRAGELLRTSQLGALPLVKRGDAVRIVARREQVEVTMSGEAMDAGARDAAVRVRTANGNVLRARVTGAGTVEPMDLPASIQPPR